MKASKAGVSRGNWESWPVGQISTEGGRLKFEIERLWNQETTSFVFFLFIKVLTKLGKNL